MLPKDIAKLVPKTHLLSESEWRNLGVQQSQGWVHYMIHEPGEPRGGAGGTQGAQPDSSFAPQSPTSCSSDGHCPRNQKSEWPLICRSSQSFHAEKAPSSFFSSAFLGGFTP